MTDTNEQVQPKKAKAEKAPKPPKDIKNDVPRPKSGSATARVWEIADEISKKTGEPAPRKEVMDTYIGEGGNTATCATQYGRWRRYHGLVNIHGGPGRPKKEKAAEAPKAPAADPDTKVEGA